MAQIAGYNENCTFYFAGTTFITVRQNQPSESRETHGHFLVERIGYSKFSLFHEESNKHIWYTTVHTIHYKKLLLVHESAKRITVWFFCFLFKILIKQRKFKKIQQLLDLELKL